MLRNIFKISGLPSKTDTTIQKCYLRTFISAPTTINWTDRRSSYTRSCSAPWDTQHGQTSSNTGQRELFMRHQSSRKSKSCIRSVEDQNLSRFPTNSPHHIKIKSCQNLFKYFKSNGTRHLVEDTFQIQKTNLGTHCGPDPIVCKFDIISNTRSCPSINPSLLNAFPADETLNNVELVKSNSFIELKRQKLATEEINELNPPQTSPDPAFPKNFKPRAFNLKDQDFINKYSTKSNRYGYKKESNKRNDADKRALHPFANKAAARIILIDANYRSNPKKSLSISSILKTPQGLRKEYSNSEDRGFSEDIDVLCRAKYQPLYLPKEISFNYASEEINKMKKILDTAVSRVDPSTMSFHEHFIYKLETDLALRMEELQAATKKRYTGGTKPSKKLSGLAITSKNLLVDPNRLTIRKYHVLTKLPDKKLTEKNNYTDLRQLKGEINSLDNLRKTQWRINNFYKWHKLNTMHNVQLTLKRSYSNKPQGNYFLSNDKATGRGSIRLKSTRSCTNIADESGKIKVRVNKETFLPAEKDFSSEEFYPETVNASKYINKYYDDEDRKSYKEDEEDSKSAYREDDNETQQDQDYFPKNRQLTLKDMMDMGINDLRRKLFHLEPERYDDDSDDAKSNDYREHADDEENYSRKGYKRYIKKLKREGLIPKDFTKNFKLPEKAEYLDESMSDDEPTNEEANYSRYSRRKSLDGPEKETYYSRYEKKVDDTLNKVVKYFKAMPGVPSADEFKKKYYRKKAEKYAKLAGLVVLEKDEQSEDNDAVAHPSTDQDELHLKPILSTNVNNQHTRSYSTLSTNNYQKLFNKGSDIKLEQTCINKARCYSTSAQNQIDHAGIPDGGRNSFHPLAKDFFDKVIKSTKNFFDPEVISQESVDSDDEETIGEQKKADAESVPSEDKKCCSGYTGNNFNNFNNRRFSISMMDSAKAGSETAPDSNENVAEPPNPEVESVCSIDSDDFSETGVPVNQDKSKDTKGPSSPDPIVNLIQKRCYSRNTASEDLDAINKSLDEKDHQRLTETIVKSIIEATTAQCQQNAAKRVVCQPRITQRKMTLAEIIFSEPRDDYEKYFKATCLAAFLEIFRKTEMLSDANFEEAEKIKTDDLVKELNKLLTEDPNEEKDC